jgi:hypothetical protein
VVKVNSRMEDMSFLQFIYFTHKGGSPKKIKLPFIENIAIKEDQKANYVDFDPVGRAGNLFSYTGSKSRNLKLSFNFTFDNIAEFSTVPLESSVITGPFQGMRQFFVDLEKSKSNGSYSAFHKIDDGGVPFDKDTDKNVQLIMYWVNLIRSSTVNNVDDPTLPPPLVRVNHGVMYRNIPCICKSYSITNEEQAGYERTSFLPRRIKVSMDLYEVRLDVITKNSILSGLGVEEIREIEVNDSLRGWETVINGESMDPVTKIITQT